jgi:NDP-sugar pyrophosphorylase family protein
MINVLMLAAGKGSRFIGYSENPKPFIDVHGIPMYKKAFDSLGLENTRNHFLFQESHFKQFLPDAPGTIHLIDGYTDGAATSAEYVIKNSIYKDEPWLIVDCDFILDWDKKIDEKYSAVFVEKYPWDPKSSYSFIHNNQILCTAEKQCISMHRNTGHYFWSSGNLFLECYDFYVANNLRVKEEFYISPLYNAAVHLGEKIKPVYVNKFIQVGTPGDLQKYLDFS